MIRNITTFDFKELNRFEKIFVLVSGGIDSTLLFEYCLQYCDNNKVYAVNCYNPFETNETIKEIAKYERFIQIKAENEPNYKQVLIDSFRNIEKAKKARAEGKYSKHVFSCCKFIKHDAFKKHPLFKQENTVVLSGIKPTDGQQRRLWLQYLRTGKATTKGAKPIDAPTFYYKHQEGQLYCYPFRDYKITEDIHPLKGTDFPEDIMEELYQKYPNLNHSGCTFCPVLVVFKDRILKSKKVNQSDLNRLKLSLEYYNTHFNQEKKEKTLLDY